MEKNKLDFKLETWLRQGAVIGQVGKWVDVFWGEPQACAKEKDFEGAAIYRNTFFTDEAKPWHVFPKQKTFEWREWKAMVAELKDKDKSAKNAVLKWEEPSFDDFEKTFDMIQKEIKSKKIVKAVPVVYSQSKRTVSHQTVISNALKQTPKNTYIYGFWNEDEGFCGFSPEVLFLCEGDKKIKTMALAGTRRREEFVEDPEQFLRNSKELREHMIVVDDIKARLSPHGKMKIGITAFLELNYMAHLYTPIQLTAAEPIGFEKMVSLLHPTPALGVSPREQAPLLKRLRHPKDILGAPFGLLSKPADMLCVVGIRHLRWNKTHFLIGAGCGVVAESKLEEEWQELKLKKESVRKIFKI